MSNNNNARYKELRVERRFEPPLYVPSFTHKDSHYPLLDLPQKDLHWEITTYKQGVHNSKTHTPLHKRVSTKQRKDFNLVIT